MRRSFAELSEVTRRANEAAAEVVHPKSIRECAWEERVAATDEMLGKCQSPTARWQRGVLHGELDGLTRRDGDR